MKLAAKLFVFATALGAVTPLYAETFTFEAVTDFTDINAGEVPYYRHNGVNALAINAATEAYRDKFARATLIFAEAGGTYDVTITSLGETDGDGEFRFLVDGVVVGSGVNEPASEDYGQQFHTFENINIPAGALIGVESIAVSNGLIPEGDAYAYARGRWTTLTITDVDDESSTPDPVAEVDLALDLTASNTAVTIDDTLTYSVAVVNYSDQVATDAVVTVDLNDANSDANSETCNAIDAGVLTCQLAELSPNDTTEFNITATATTAGELQINAEVSANESDSNTANNEDSVSVSVAEAIEINTDFVDLDLNLSASRTRIEIDDSVIYSASVTNLSNNITATAPVIGIVLPESLQFESSDYCTVSNAVVRCDLEELAPGKSAEVHFTAIAVRADSYSQVIASASSDQPENTVNNNEYQIVTDISAKAPSNVISVTDQQANTRSGNTSAEASQASVSGGGGTLSATGLLLLLLSACTRCLSHCTRYRWQRSVKT